jgi:hypothetical protein
MPTFEVRSPEGKTFQIQGDNAEGALRAFGGYIEQQKTYVDPKTLGPLSEQSTNPAMQQHSADVNNLAMAQVEAPGGAAAVARDAQLPFSNELAGGVNAVKGLFNGRGVAEEYSRGKEAADLAPQIAAARNPTESAIGTGFGIAGNLGHAGAPGAAAIVPTVGQLAKQGAVMGAIGGVDQGEGLGDRLVKGLVGAAGGAALGGVLGKGAEIAGKFGASAPAAANEAVQAADRLGVPLPRVLATDSRATQAIGEGLGSTYMGAPIRKATAATDAALGAKADELAQKAGTAGSSEATGNSLRDALNAYIKEKSPQKVSAAYDVLDKNRAWNTALNDLPATRQAAAEINATRGRRYQGPSTAAGEVEGAVNSPGLAGADIKGLRTSVNEKTKFGMMPANGSGAEYKQIGGALTQDLTKAAENVGLGSEFQAANRLAATERNLNEKLTKIVGSTGENSGASVYDKMIKAAGKGAIRADLGQLARVRSTVPQEEWNNLGSSIIQSLGRDADGNFTAQRFTTAYSKLSDGGKNVLFNPELRRALDDLHTVATKVKDSARYRNYSGTANAVAALGIIPAAIANPLAVIGGAIGTRAMATILAKPVTVRATSKWVQALGGFSRGASRATAATLTSTTKGLAKAIAGETGAGFEQVYQQLLSQKSGTPASQ